MRLAMLQMEVVHNKEENLRHALKLLEQVSRDGAQIAVLPEMFCCPYSNRYFREYGEEQGGLAWQMLSQAAQELNLWIVGGSIPELCEGKVYNTSYVFDAKGTQAAKHRKAHLFDINVEGGQAFRESEVLTPGDQVTVFDTPWGKLGLCICFDLRFQELSKLMADKGAQMIVVPAAFNMTTGPAHWELLFRQRAVDNQVFTVGVAPARDDDGEYVSFAHSMVASPWGKVLCDCGVSECVEFIDINTERINSIRKQLPILSARRTDIYKIGPAADDKE